MDEATALTPPAIIRVAGLSSVKAGQPPGTNRRITISVEAATFGNPAVKPAQMAELRRSRHQSSTNF